MEELSIQQIINGLGVLAENQNRINLKVDSILEIVANHANKNYEMQNVVNQQSMQINTLTNQLNNLTNQMSDIQIQLQNSSGDTHEIVNSINNVNMQIDDLKRSFEQWKVYSSL